MLRRPALVLPVLALAAVTACAGSSDGDSAAPASTAAAGGGAPEAVVRAAAASTTTDGTSKFTITSTSAVGEQTVSLTGEGTFDYESRDAQLSFELPSAAGQADGGTIEERIIGPDLYISLPQEPDVFYKLRVADVLDTSIGTSVDPSASLQALQAVSDVKEVEQVDVRGVPTTHYEGTYDVEAAIAKAEGADKKILEESLSRTDLKDIPFDAYIDEQGRLVKFEQSIAVEASAATGGQPLTSSNVLELYEFGAAVTVTAPAADKTRDGAPLLAALKAAVPAPTPGS